MTLEVKISDNCLLCNKKFGWQEVTIGKLPEGVFFCLKCIEKFEDKNEYHGIHTWIVEKYEPNLTFEYNESKRL